MERFNLTMAMQEILSLADDECLSFTNEEYGFPACLAQAEEALERDQPLGREHNAALRHAARLAFLVIQDAVNL